MQNRFLLVRKLLMEYFDPIGVKDVPQCEDEYDPYIIEILYMLERHSCREELERHLLGAAEYHMGLNFDHELFNAVRSVARELVLLNNKLKETGM